MIMVNSKGRTNAMSHQPLYLQIKESLKQQVLEGVYAPNEQLPSESKLMALFGVSRITVRHALNELYREGLIFTSQGKGTFARKPKATQDVHRLEGFGEAMTAKGYDTSARLLNMQEIMPPQQVLTKLNLHSEESVIEVVRVRYLNRVPVSIDQSYFPLSIGQRLFGRDLTGDIFPLLEEKLGVVLGVADIRLEARCANAEMAALLHIDVDSPVMWVERLTKDVNDRPVDYEFLTFRGDSYQYHFTVERNRS